MELFKDQAAIDLHGGKSAAGTGPALRNLAPKSRSLGERYIVNQAGSIYANLP
jgi:hypothetical protein